VRRVDPDVVLAAEVAAAVLLRPAGLGVFPGALFVGPATVRLLKSKDGPTTAPSFIVVLEAIS